MPETNPTAASEQRVRHVFDALKLLRSVEEELAQPLGKGDPVLTARQKELRGYIDVLMRQELRRKPRFTVLDRKTDSGLSMAVEVAFRDAVQFYEGLRLSLSKAGIFIKTDNLLPIDTLLTMTCRLEAEGVSFTVAGKVIWINPRETQDRPQGMGVKLYKLSSIQRQILEDFMAGTVVASALQHLGTS